MAESEPRRRRRPAVSCVLCRRRKIRCNREQPCSNCLRSRKDVACVYEELPPAPAPVPLRPQLSRPPLQVSAAQSSLFLPANPRQPPPQRAPGLPAYHNTDVLPPFFPSFDDRQSRPGRPSRHDSAVLDDRAYEPGAPFIYESSMTQPSFASESDLDQSATPSEQSARSLRRRIRKLEMQLQAVQHQRKHHHATSSSSSPGPSPPSPSEPHSPAANSVDLTVFDLDTDTAAHVTADSRTNSQPPTTPASSLSFLHTSVPWHRRSKTESLIEQVHGRPEPASPHPVHGIGFGNGQFTSRSVMHKTRLFGQSHWINSVLGFRDIFDLVEPLISDKGSRVYRDMNRLKYLARIIKTQRAPPWPTTLPATLSAAHRDLPSRPLADQLVQCYLRSSEGLFRVLHVSLFRKDYEAFWANAGSPGSLGPGGASSIPFLAQLRLVLAIGSASHPEHARLRHAATRWVHQAICWAAEPDYKGHLTIQTLQNNVLLLLARDAVGVGSDLIWIAVGDLFRSAVYMGLHRDPLMLPKRPSRLAAEMRRRLWNTILELAVNTSLDAGGPVMLSRDDFDTRPPGNFDDEELLGDSTDCADVDTAGHPPHVLTQTSVSIALRRTLPLRLAIVRFLNNLGPRGSYQDTLQLDCKFRSEFRALCQTLVALQNGGTAPPGTSAGPDEKPIPHIQLGLIDIMLQRYLLCLHIPFFGTAINDTAAYAYSRRAVIDTAVKIWRTGCGGTDEYTDTLGEMAPDSLFPPPSSAPFVGPAELIRIAMLGHGCYRKNAMQASLLIAGEVKLKLLEDNAHENVGLLSALSADDLDANLRPVRPDLIQIVFSARDWSLKGIDAGEVNCKGYLLWYLVITQIDGLRRGMICAPNATPESQLELAKQLVLSGEESMDKCMPLMERHVAEGQARLDAEAKAAAADNDAVATRAVAEVDVPPASPQSTENPDPAAVPVPPGPDGQMFPRPDLQAMPEVDSWDFLMADIQMSDLGRNSEPYNWLFPNETTHGPLW